MQENRRRRKRRWLLRLALLPIIALGALTAVLWSYIGHPVAAPDWLSARIEERLDSLVPGARIEFADLRLVVERDGLARVQLTNAALLAPDDSEIATLSELEIAAAIRPLLSREIELREARASGAFLSVVRDVSGRLGIGLGLEARERPSVPELISRIDAQVQLPRFAALDVVTLDGVTIRYTDERQNRSWTADGGRVAIERDGGNLRLSGDASILGGGASAASLSMDAESPIGETDLSFGLSLADLRSRDIATQSPALAWLDALRAPISGSLRGWLDETGTLGGLDATLRIGEGVLQPTDRVAPVRFAGARTYFSYDPAAGRIVFSDISVDSTVGRARAEGRASIDFGDGARPEALIGQFVLSGLDANPGDLFPEPLSVERAELDFRLRLDPFEVEIGRLRVDDEDIGLHAKGHVRTGPDGWGVSLDATAPRATPETVAAHWPPSLIPRTREWFEANVIDGTVQDAVFALRLEPGGQPDLYLDFGIEDATVLFVDTLPPARNAAGRFTFHDRRMSVRVDAGIVTPPEGGDIDLAGTQVVIPDTAAEPSILQIDIAAEAPATAALSLIDQEPLRVMQKAGRPVDLFEGRAQITGTLVRPIAPGVGFDGTELNLAGRLTDLRSDTVVPGRTLMADALDLRVTNERVQVTGRAALSGVPFDGSWTQPIGGRSGSRVEGTVTLSADAADRFGIGLPDGLLSGQGPGQLTVALSGDAPRFELTSSLSGIGLSIPQIGWALGRQSTGQFAISGSLGATPSIDSLSVNAGGLRTSGRIALRPGGGLDRLTLDRVRIGNWLDAPVTLVGRGAGAAPEVRLNGGRIDLRQARLGGGAGGGGGGGTPIRVALDRLTISEGIQLTGVAGRFATRGSGLDGGFTAQMAGTGAPIEGQLLPQNGGTGVRIASSDAGDVLESTGILKTVAGGRMVLNLAPVPGVAGTYDGAVTVTDARLRDAPAIGALLDAISIVGIIDQLEGPGIYFQNVEARFRLSPERVTLTRSSATGPSMGISLDGYYDLGSQRIDMQGVLSPIYVLNSIGSIFTRRGEGLLGFNFTLRGTAASPSVAVNPLSVFTPGMFREIFRRPPPTTD